MRSNGKLIRGLLVLLIACETGFSFGQSNLKYTLDYLPQSKNLSIVLEFDSIPISQARLVIPRSAPGTYHLTDYLAFVYKVSAYTTGGEKLMGKPGIGSFFSFGKEEGPIGKISYEVDVQRMESELKGGFASSKSRTNYLGLLGYSIFGFLEGFEDIPIFLTINTDKTWPIFSTLRPSTEQKYGGETYKAENFAMLADAQYLLGNSVQIIRMEESEIPLYIAVYSEVPINIQEIGRRCLVSLNGLAEYFGYIPMPHYTAFYEFIKPISKKHDYGFAMEHMNSFSSTQKDSRAITEYDSNAKIGGIVHHMGHSWIPLRPYGKGYRPFDWQTAPLIETIWLNEGFIWYITYYYVLKNKGILDFFKKSTNNAPGFIKNKSLKELSLLASTQYGEDFRIGKNIFSRGALLAYDLDTLIKKETNGQRSLKDAVLGLLKWSEDNQRPYGYDKIKQIMAESTGVNLDLVWDKWQKPMND